MKPGYNGNSEDWTSPDPWIHEQQGTVTAHGPGPGGGRER
jgi:hypothetical protein